MWKNDYKYPPQLKRSLFILLVWTEMESMTHVQGVNEIQGFSPWLGSEGRAVSCARRKEKKVAPAWKYKMCRRRENFIIFQVYKSHSRSLSLSL